MKVEGVIFTQILESTILQGVHRLYPVIRGGHLSCKYQNRGRETWTPRWPWQQAPAYPWRPLLGSLSWGANLQVLGA